MKTYQKRPKKGSKNTTSSISKAPGLLTILLAKIYSLFAPLNDFQKALYYSGLPKKPSKLATLYKDNASVFALLERVLVVAFIVFALFTNAYLLLLLPLTGALLFYRNRVIWLWWKLKVYVLQRSFYADRRQLYNMGTLYHHLKHKRPKKFKHAIIWGQSKSVQQTKFNKLQKNNQLKNKEYISL